MSGFSEQEFNIMIDQLLHREPASFDMLCCIAEKTLRRCVYKWCSEDCAFRGRGFEEDILQTAYMKIIKTCVTSFLLRNGADGPVNNDVAGFKSWMFEIARNVKRDFAKDILRISRNCRPFEEGEEEDVPDTADDTTEFVASRRELLARAFDIVLDADVKVYKTLTWIAQFLFVIELDVAKIQSTDLILTTFDKKTLYEMHITLRDFAKKVPWVKITARQNEKIEKALSSPYDGERKYGEVQYAEFFMKKGGKATISDWVNRMNSIIKRVMTDEALNS